jgi:uncharacterized protein YjiS (DUF1127 family)
MDGVTLASKGRHDLWSPNPAVLTDAPRRPYGPAALRDTIALWRRRMDFRCELARLAKDSPALIDDLGLTMQDVGRESSKPFWRR